jgi:flagellar protein FlaJ
MFEKLERSKRSQYQKVSTKTTSAAPRQVRVAKGGAAEYVRMTKYQEFCWHTLGKRVLKNYKNNPKLELQLLQAHIRMRQEEYMAYQMMTAFIVAGVVAVAAVFLDTILIGSSPAFAMILTLVMIILPGPVTFFVIGSIPGSTASTRKRDIDKRLGQAMSFVSAMASADVTVDIIFKELSRQKLYGEIRAEAEWITRDCELMGVDILTSISRAAQRSPSTKFQEFLQGVITTTSSGGQLKPYFLMKAEQFEKEHKIEMRRGLESLGLMAETFVTVVVAFPLFLIIIMAIMAIVPGNGTDAQFTVNLLYIIVGVMVPVSQFGFIFFIWNQTKEASF